MRRQLLADRKEAVHYRRRQVRSRDVFDLADHLRGLREAEPRRLVRRRHRPHFPEDFADRPLRQARQIGPDSVDPLAPPSVESIPVIASSLFPADLDGRQTEDQRLGHRVLDSVVLVASEQRLTGEVAVFAQLGQSRLKGRDRLCLPGAGRPLNQSDVRRVQGDSNGFDLSGRRIVAEDVLHGRRKRRLRLPPSLRYRASFEQQPQLRHGTFGQSDAGLCSLPAL